MRQRANALYERTKRFLKENSGVAAVEMAMLSPLLMFGMVAMMDVGVAVSERMELDRSVRSGVQAAISNVSDLTEIKSVVLASAENNEKMSVAIDKNCSCGSIAASCTALCTGDEPPSVYIDIKASRLHIGMIMPDLNLESESRVQLR